MSPSPYSKCEEGRNCVWPGTVPVDDRKVCVFHWRMFYSTDKIDRAMSATVEGTTGKATERAVVSARTRPWRRRTNGREADR